jgi:Uma2 family endonuclease
VNARVKEYLEFGVPVVWLIDLEEKKIWIYRQTGMEEASGNTVHVDGTELELPLSEIFD